MYNYSTSAKIRQGRQYNFKSEKDKSRYLHIITPIKGSFLAHITVRPVFLCLFFTIYGFWKVKIISHFLLHNLLTNAFEFVIIYKPLKRHDSLAQVVEHMTFNHGVRSSNLRWVTKRQKRLQSETLLSFIYFNITWCIFSPKQVLPRQIQSKNLRRRKIRQKIYCSRWQSRQDNI